MLHIFSSFLTSYRYTAVSYPRL